MHTWYKLVSVFLQVLCVFSQNEIKLLTPLVQATVDEVNGKMKLEMKVVHSFMILLILGKKDVMLLGDFNMSPDNSSKLNVQEIF